MSIYIIVDSQELDYYCSARFEEENEMAIDYVTSRQDYYKFFEQYKKEEIYVDRCNTVAQFSKFINILMKNGYKCKGGCNIACDGATRLMQTMIKENSNISYDMSNFLKS